MDTTIEHTHEWQIWDAGSGIWATCKFATKYGCEAYLNKMEIEHRLNYYSAGPVIPIDVQQSS